jgi:hypothetical protein
MSKELKDIVKRAEAWPKKAQDELVRAAEDIEKAVSGHRARRPRLTRPSPRARAQAWKQLEALFARLKASNPQLPQSPDEIRTEEEEIAEDIRLMRRRQRHA